MTPKEMPIKVLELEERVKLLESVTGIAGPWLSPSEAAKILPIGRDRILAEIQQAEQKRAARRKWDLVFGTHYYNSGVNEKPNWRICVSEFWSVVQKPSNERIQDD